MIQSGLKHTCILLIVKNSLVCFGDNTYNQLDIPEELLNKSN